MLDSSVRPAIPKLDDGSSCRISFSPWKQLASCADGISPQPHASFVQRIYGAARRSRPKEGCHAEVPQRGEGVPAESRLRRSRSALCFARFPHPVMLHQRRAWLFVLSKKTSMQAGPSQCLTCAKSISQSGSATASATGDKSNAGDGNFKRTGGHQQLPTRPRFVRGGSGFA